MAGVPRRAPCGAPERGRRRPEGDPREEEDGGGTEAGEHMAARRARQGRTRPGGRFRQARSSRPGTEAAARAAWQGKRPGRGPVHGEACALFVIY